MAEKEKPKKERAEHYDPKLKVKGTFEDVINVLIKSENKKPGDEKAKPKK